MKTSDSHDPSPGVGISASANLLPSSGRRLWLALLTTCVAVFGSPSRATTGLAVGLGSAGPGESVTLPIRLESDAPKVALQFDVRFDAAKLRPGTAVVPAGSANRVALSSSPTPGLQRVIVYSADGTSLPNGTIANLTWYIPPDAISAQATLTLTNAIIGDRAAKPATDTALTHGTITIRSDTAPQFQPPVIAGGQFVAQLSGLLGRQYQLQASSNLVQWEDTLLASPANGVVTFRDPLTPGRSQRFYRAILLP